MHRCLLVAVLAAGLLLPAAALAKNPSRPVMLDTDIGNYLDDAVALAMLLSRPDIDLKAITTSGGDCEDRAWIVCRLLSMVGRERIPVAWGRDPQPKNDVQEMFQYRYHPAVLFNRTAKPKADKDAAELLYEKLKEQEKGATTLLAIGPLTNVARLLEKHPDSKEMLKRIVIMGGELKRGKEPEWNFAQDIPATQAVLESGVPLTIVPLEAAKTAKLSQQQRDRLFAMQTMLTQQLQTLYQLSDETMPVLYDAVAAAVVLDGSVAQKQTLGCTVDKRGFLDADPTNPKRNAAVVTGIDQAQFQRGLERIGTFGDKVKPRELANFSQVVDRGGLPARVHAFEDLETDIERRWWLAGRLLTKDAPNGERAMQSVLTLDFDDLQGDLKTMYSAVVFNPVPGPPMGPRTRLAFRYRLHGTDQLRVQLYSLSNGYHRYLALKDLPQDEWQEATVDMTDMRRPDGSGGALADDERIDDIQFYVAPTARVSVDDVVLYDAAPDGDTQPFPKRIVFTGWFDTGKQGKEWPGDYEIVENEKPRKWKAAKSVLNKELDQPWLRVSFRGERPIGATSVARFKYRLTGAESFTVQLANSKGRELHMEQHVDKAKSGDWQELSLSFSLADARNSAEVAALKTADELRFLLPRGAELLVDDVLVYEPDR
jgi:purine nucleosidase/pyrimidine-specific ribonucleoside hydrolase